MTNFVVKGVTNGTGDVTLQAPETNANRTLTVPDSDGTLLTNNSKLNGANLLDSSVSLDALTTNIAIENTVPIFRNANLIDSAVVLTIDSNSNAFMAGPITNNGTITIDGTLTII